MSKYMDLHALNKPKVCQEVHQAPARQLQDRSHTVRLSKASWPPHDALRNRNRTGRYARPRDGAERPPLGGGLGPRPEGTCRCAARCSGVSLNRRQTNGGRVSGPSFRTSSVTWSSPLSGRSLPVGGRPSWEPSSRFCFPGPSRARPTRRNRTCPEPKTGSEVSWNAFGKAVWRRS